MNLHKCRSAGDTYIGQVTGRPVRDTELGKEFEWKGNFTYVNQTLSDQVTDLPPGVDVVCPPACSRVSIRLSVLGGYDG